MPIATGGELHGAVRITYPLSFVNDRIRDTWLVLAGVGAIVLLAVSLVGVLVARSLTRPLASLEAGAESLGQGELDTLVDVPSGPHELVTLARAFNTTAARLEQLLDAQQAFVADASHQLRTPLSALRLRLENLQSAVPSAEAGDVDGALEEVGRLSMLVDGLLELARAEGHGSAPADVDVHELATLRRDAWAALSEERGVTIEIDVPTSLHARATPGRLEQVLDNLMNNALEVAPDGSTIRVSARREGDRAVMTVSDQGPGMSLEQRERASIASGASTAATPAASVSGSPSCASSWSPMAATSPSTTPPAAVWPPASRCRPARASGAAPRRGADASRRPRGS